MTAVWGFLLGLIGAVCAWFVSEFFGRPFRQFFDMRRDVSSSLVRFANVRARAKRVGDAVSLNDLPKPEEERLMEAQDTFRHLGGDMRGFANSEYFASLVVSWFGYDAFEISAALIGYSNEIVTYGEARKHFHDRIEELLGIRSDK